jgi:hypothetical protein
VLLAFAHRHAEILRDCYDHTVAPARQDSSG